MFVSWKETERAEIVRCFALLFAPSCSQRPCTILYLIHRQAAACSFLYVHMHIWYAFDIHFGSTFDTYVNLCLHVSKPFLAFGPGQKLSCNKQGQGRMKDSTTAQHTMLARYLEGNMTAYSRNVASSQSCLVATGWEHEVSSLCRECERTGEREREMGESKGMASCSGCNSCAMQREREKYAPKFPVIKDSWSWTRRASASLAS